MSTTSGPMPCDRLDRLAPVARLADDGDLGVGLEQGGHPGPHQLVVVDEQHPDHDAAPELAVEHEPPVRAAARGARHLQQRARHRRGIREQLQAEVALARCAAHLLHVEPRPVVHDVEDDGSRAVAVERHGHRRRPGVLGGVAQALLGDPVHQALGVGRHREVVLVGGVDPHDEVVAAGGLGEVVQGGRRRRSGPGSRGRCRRAGCAASGCSSARRRRRRRGPWRGRAGRGRSRWPRRRRP